MVIAGIGAFLISVELFAFRSLNQSMDKIARGMGSVLQSLDTAVSVVSAASKLIPQKAQNPAAGKLLYGTAAQENSLRKFLQDYTKSFDSDDSDEIKATRYFAAFVHLRGDDTQQVIVHLIGSAWCGTGGCTALILVPKGSSYTILTAMSVAQQPIRVLDTKSHGWHDLGIWVQGGGIQPGYEARLSFDGKEYPSNPTMPPAQPLTTKTSGKVVVPRSGTGEPLYPQQRSQ